MTPEKKNESKPSELVAKTTDLEKIRKLRDQRKALSDEIKKFNFDTKAYRRLENKRKILMGVAIADVIKTSRGDYMKLSEDQFNELIEQIKTLKVKF